MRQTPLTVVLALAVGAVWTAGAQATTLAEQVAAMPMPEAGVHPRVLFTADELPKIRARAATVNGQATVVGVQWECDQPGKATLEGARASTETKPEQLVDYAFKQALVWLATEDAQRLQNAKDLLSAWAKQHAQKPFYNRHAYQFALAYDWLYNELPEEVRDGMREHMAAQMNENTLDGWEHLGYYMGPVAAGRPCDWGAIESGGFAMMWMAIAGDDPRASREFLGKIVDFMKYIADYGLSAEGQLLAGNGYAGGDFINYGYGVRALQQHGVMLVDHPNFREFAIWLAHESIPGEYMFDNRNYSSGFHQGPTPLILTLATRDNPAAKWLVDQALGPERTTTYGTPGLLWGEYSDKPVAPPDLPLCRWSSSMGPVLSRSGWEQGSFFCITMEPFGGGKVHGDKGAFTFYSHGLAFAADSGDLNTRSEDHNGVLIDGKAMLGGGANVSDAIVRNHMHSELGDFTLMDVKPAFEQYVGYTQTRPGKADWVKLEYGLGLPYIWVKRMSLERADRYALYVRGSVQPYAVIVDDYQQDENPRRYTWQMHSRAWGEVSAPGQVTWRSRYGGEYLQSEERGAPALFSGEVAEAGQYTVWVLMRKWPAMKNWFTHPASITVNGRGGGYKYLGDHLADWGWYGYAEQNLVAGKNTVGITLARGGRVAQVVVSRDPEWTPDTMVGTEAGPGIEALPPTATLLPRQTAAEGGNWSLQTDPRARMQVRFIQPGAEALEFSFAHKPRMGLTCLQAEQQVVQAGFAAVLLPHDDRDPQPELTREGDTGEAVLRWGPYTDYLFADPARKLPYRGANLETDARFALVRTEGERVVGYMLAGGHSLAFRGKLLVGSSAGPLCVMNDGNSCQVQAPGGAIVRALHLGATVVECNHQPVRSGIAGELLIVPLPRLAQEWKVETSEDGSTVTVEGDGPQPLKIQAPQAIKCVVNGVSVWFSRDGFGNIYPKLELTVLTHGREPRDSKPEDAWVK